MKCVLVVLWLRLISSTGETAREYCGDEVKKVYDSPGLLRLGLLLRQCSSLTPKGLTRANSAIWTTKQLNHLNYTQPYSLGLSIFRVCTRQDYYRAIFELFKKVGNGDAFVLGVVSDEEPVEDLGRFGEALGVPVSVAEDYGEGLVRASVKLLVALEWRENVTVFAEKGEILEEFEELSRTFWICVENFILLE